MPNMSPAVTVTLLAGAVVPTAAQAAVTDNGGGAAANGTIEVVTNPDLSGWNGATDPTAAQATAINAAITALKAAVKELSAARNADRTALIAAGVLT